MRVLAQFGNIVVAFVAMWIVANMPLHYLMRAAVPIYVLGMILLLLVMTPLGVNSHGATALAEHRRGHHPAFRTDEDRRAADDGLVLRKERSLAEVAKLFCRGHPSGAAHRPDRAPARPGHGHPDLGSGFYVLFLAGLCWRLMIGSALAAIASAPFLWSMLHDYQRHRILMLLDPSQDALGKGYHTIQGMIAVGSGGILGKGFMNGTQTHLDFLPERTTDFIFAVWSEEFGLIGNLLLLGLYVFVIGRGFIITANASTYFTRLMAGSITLTFFTYAFVNMGMVSGILPVVGVPLPLISYGGTSMLTLMLGFGMLMSIHSHKKLVKT